jgi:GNAT superfamily N-acetyltransferase
MVNGSSGERQVALRPATQDDGAFLLEVYGSTRDELNVLSWDDIQKQAFIRMQFNARQHQYHENYLHMSSDIVLLNNEPIGSMLVNRGEREITLVDIALLPEHRNAGIGMQLVRALLDEAAAAKKPVRLHVFATSAAVRMYERLGFSKTDDDGTYLEMIWVS